MFRFVKQHYVGILTLIIAFSVVRFVVVRYRRPGAMTVIEEQAMDMSESGTPRGLAPVDIEIAEPRTFAPTVSYTGSVVALNDDEIYPRVTGVLTSVLVYPGDRVLAGQVVARLDSAELSSRQSEAAAAHTGAEHEAMIASAERSGADAQHKSALAKRDSMLSAVQDAESQVSGALAAREQSERERDAAMAAVTSAQASSEEARADAEYWRSEIVREEKLFLAKAVSRDEVDRERAQARAAEAKLNEAASGVAEKRAMVAVSAAKIGQADHEIEGARARLAKAKADLEGAKADAAAADANLQVNSHHIMHQSAMAAQAAAQERTADIIRGYTEIRAAQAGVVTERLVSPGTLVQPGMPLLRIKNSDSVRLQANVAASDLNGIQVGSAVTVSEERKPTLHFRAHITSIFSAANPQSHTVVVEALASNSSNRFLPGEYISMEIGTSASRNVLTVPTSAIQRDGDQYPFLWIAKEVKRSGKIDYTCVMHPQIHQDHPGNCPICAMKLVPRERGGKLCAAKLRVTLGHSDGNRIVVESGLSPGAAVITKGFESLNEGDPVGRQN